MARVSGARERFGPQDARELARLHYNQPIEIPPAIRHAAGRLEYMADAVVEKSAILATAGRAGGTPDVPFRLPIPPPARSEARRLVGDAERLVALCPGTRWRSKRWPVSRWARLVHELATELPDVQVALLGAESESSLVREILSEAGADEGGPMPRDLTGQGGLWTAAAILELAECAVAMDSAQLHLAAAVGTPTVSLFGPTDPARFAPRGPEHQVLQKDELLCLGCHRRECPLERRACLPDLEAGPVLEAVRRTLGGRA